MTWPDLDVAYALDSELRVTQYEIGHSEFVYNLHAYHIKNPTQNFLIYPAHKAVPNSSSTTIIYPTLVHNVFL